MSAHLDGDLSAVEAGQVEAHLDSCGACGARWRSLRASLDLLTAMPAVPPPGIASRVRDRLEVESRGPGLALLFRPYWAARPLILPSLVPAALVVVTVLSAAVALDRDAHTPTRTADAETWRTLLPPGTEGNPLFPTGEVSVPRIRNRSRLPESVANGGSGESTLFFQTVVARDGSVSDVKVLDGNSERARPFVDALRRERFEPGRLKGRPVAVSLYRLISTMEVRSPAI
jgi:hypothetical protein